MKYLVNILFVCLFFVTVGCNNELIGPAEDINPTPSLSAEEVTFVEVGFGDASGALVEDLNKKSTDNGIGEGIEMTTDPDEDYPLPPTD